DYAALTAQTVGDRLTLQLRRDGQVRTVTLTAAVFTLTPVDEARVYSTQGGRRLGVVVVKDMIQQALTPLASVFTRLRAEGVDEVVMDLRYNGGGLVSTGAMLASYVAGTRGDGRDYATLLYNDRRAGNNQTFAFERPAAALTLSRVFVLVGRRTCSASE